MLNKIRSKFIDYKPYKSKVSLWSVRHIHQNLAFPIFLLSRRFGLSPNVITFASLVLFIIGALCFSKENYIGSCLFWLVSYIFDCADGAIARSTNKTSRFGAFFDLSVDRMCSLIMLLLVFNVLNFQSLWDYVAVVGVLLLVYNSFISVLRPLYFPELKGFGSSSSSALVTFFKIPYELMDSGNAMILISLSFFFGHYHELFLFYAIFSLLLLAFNFRIIYRIEKNEVKIDDR
ncbi:hypothetical protein BCT94_18805 [Vibrio breoganii]|nr:hypothetical protein BCT94_18805 [Vibrio breoganii]PML79948.1 hypothetical protein BCT68_15900 [Vibrio breoganii]